MERYLRPESCTGYAGRADAPRRGGVDTALRRDDASVLRELAALRQQVQQQQLQLERLEGRRMDGVLAWQGSGGGSESAPSATAAFKGDTGSLPRAWHLAASEL